MKNEEITISVNVPAEFHRLVKTSAAAAESSIQEQVRLMALSFWEFDLDAAAIEKREIAAKTVHTLTKGKRPFDGGAAGQMAA